MNKEDKENETILIVGELTEEKVEYVLETLIEADLTLPIDIYINSTGGDLNTGAAIIDYIRYIKTKGAIINTYAIGVCSSLAAILFLMGTYRKIGLLCHFMLHKYLEGGACEMENSDLSRVSGEHADKWFLNIMTEVLKDTDVDIDYIYDKWSQVKTINWVVTPIEAHHLKLATELY